MTQQIILTRGIPASGKTTWAVEYVRKHPEFINVNRDDLRASMFPAHYNKNTYKPSRKREQAVTWAQHDIARIALKEGQSVIVSDTNLSKQAQDNWFNFFEGALLTINSDITIEYKNFDCDLDTALERNALRDGGVPPKVIYDMYERYMEQVHPEWKVEHAEGAPDAIIVDVDGTVADHTGIRSPYDASKVKFDCPHFDVVDLVHWLSEYHHVIIMTGRDGSAEQDTREWLDKYNIPYDELFIRAEGDTRKDSVIKRELFDEHVRGKYNVKYVIDDRLQVIYMWRALGLRVLDVAGGAF